MLWLDVVFKYGSCCNLFLCRIVAPKIEKRDTALASLKEKQAMLAAAEAKLQELAETLQRLQKEYEEKLKHKEELNEKVMKYSVVLLLLHEQFSLSILGYMSIYYVFPFLQATSLMMKLERAAALVQGLSGERERWTHTVAYLDQKFDLLPGDVLLAVASVSYLGPFITVYREEMIDIWLKCVSYLHLFCTVPNN